MTQRKQRKLEKSMNEATSFRQKLINLILRIYRSDAMLPLLIFIGVWTTFVVLRLGFDIILTDTDFYMAWPHEIDWRNMFYAWQDNPPSWYRPLDTSLVFLILGAFWKNFTPIICIQMLVPAMSAVLLFLITKEVTKGNRLIALVAAILFAFSLGEIEVSWLFVHKSIVADILFLCAILGYLRYTRTGRMRWFTLMIFGGLTAPWIREIGGSVSGALLLFALLERRKDKKLLVALLLLVFHGVYPAFFTNLLIFQKISLMSIFERSSWGFGIPFATNISPEVPFKVALYISPIATILAMASIIFSFASKGRRGRLIAISVTAVLVLSMVSLFYPQKTLLTTTIMPLVFGATIFLTTFPRNKLLPLWFTLASVPFFVMPAHDAWLRLAAMGYIVTCLIWIYDLPANFRAFSSRIPFLQSAAGTEPGRLKYLPAIAFAILMLIAVNNVVISSRTFSTTIDANQNIARWLTENTEQGSALISSVRVLPEVQYYSNDWIDARYVRLPFTLPLPGGHSPSMGRLETVTLSHYERGVYLMVSEKYGTVGFPEGISDDELEPVQSFVISAKYPMFDPFQMWLPEHYRRYGGPTDVLHEFNLIHTPFMGEARCVLNFYKLERQPLPVESGYHGFNIIRWGNMFFGIPEGEPGFAPGDVLDEYDIVGFGFTPDEAKESIDNYLNINQNFPKDEALILDSYVNYNIFFQKDRFYAIPQGESAFNLARYSAGGYDEGFDAGSPEVLELLIDDLLLTGLPPYRPHDFNPALMVRDYKGFDIYFFRGRVYGVPHFESPFDYQQFARGQYAACIGPFKAHPETIMFHIDQGSYQLQPEVTEEDYRGFKIIRFGGRSYAIPSTEDFSYERYRNQEYTPSFVNVSADEVKKSVLIYLSQYNPVLVEEYAGFAIYLSQGNYYAVPLAEGDFDLRKFQDDGYSISFSGESLSKVRLLTAEHTLANMALTEIYTDDETAWRAEPGVEFSEETETVKVGESSLKIEWSNSSSAYCNLPSSQDWSDSRYVGFYVYGANSGATMAMQIRFRGYGGEHWVDYRWVDDFSGWKPMLFELDKPSQSSGITDWKDVCQVLFRPIGEPPGTLYFDNLVRDSGVTMVPVTEEPNYLGFAITSYGSQFYATPTSEGDFNLNKLQSQDYSTSFSGDSLGEVQALIIEHFLDTMPSVEVYGDDETVWHTEPAATISEETNIVKEGDSSLKVTWDNSQSAVYYNFPAKQDWSGSRYIILHVYGADSGTPMAMQVRFKGTGGQNWIDFRWTDDFSGWKAMLFELDKPSKSSGITDWQNVWQVLFRPLAKQSITLYFDGLVLDEPAEATTAGTTQSVARPAEEIYYGFKIKPWAGDYYAIPQDEGEFEIQRIASDNYSQYFSANSTDEVRELITDSILEGTRPIEVYYQSYQTLWRSEPSVSHGEEKTIVKEGDTSLRAVWENSRGAVYCNFRSSKSWPRAKYISFYVYGANSGTPMALQIRFRRLSGQDWVDFRWTDDFSGWRRLVFELDNPSNASGFTTWRDVRQVLFRPLSPLSGTLYFDQLMWHKET